MLNGVASNETEKELNIRQASLVSSEEIDILMHIEISVSSVSRGKFSAVVLW